MLSDDFNNGNNFILITLLAAFITKFSKQQFSVQKFK